MIGFPGNRFGDLFHTEINNAHVRINPSQSTNLWWRMHKIGLTFAPNLIVFTDSFRLDLDCWLISIRMRQKYPKTREIYWSRFSGLSGGDQKQTKSSVWNVCYAILMFGRFPRSEGVHRHLVWKLFPSENSRLWKSSARSLVPSCSHACPGMSLCSSLDYTKKRDYESLAFEMFEFSIAHRRVRTRFQSVMGLQTVQSCQIQENSTIWDFDFFDSQMIFFQNLGKLWNVTICMGWIYTSKMHLIW